MNKKDLKTPKFIIGENPMVELSGEFITHMREPVFYAEVFLHKDKIQQSNMHDELVKFQEETKQSVAVGRDKDFYQPFTLVATNISAKTQEEVDNIAKIMRRMADWYQVLIIWEDKQNELD